MIHQLDFSLGVGKLQISLQPYWSDLLNTKDMEHKLAKMEQQQTKMLLENDDEEDTTLTQKRGISNHSEKR